MISSLDELVKEGLAIRAHIAIDPIIWEETNDAIVWLQQHGVEIVRSLYIEDALEHYNEYMAKRHRLKDGKFPETTCALKHGRFKGMGSLRRKRALERRGITEEAGE
jgi:hypothetical protein